MAGVDLIEIVKNFGSTKVLESIHLSIQSGEFVVLVGPSGCGKSTLLRIVAGLEAPTSGVVRIDQKEVNHLSPKERGIAMVFQSYALYPHMTARQNLAFSLKLSKSSKAEIARRVNEVAQILGIEPLLDKKPSQLSGGQKQRVAIGRAMVRNPKVFLFDEPLSNLDAQLRVKMRSELSLLHNRLGSTVIYVTHDQAEAMTLAHRIVVLNGGKIEQIGTPLEIYNHPKTQFVASFIGTPSMNFLPGEKNKTIGFRPENLYFKDEVNSVTLGAGVVRLVEPLGSQAHVHVEIADRLVVAEMKTDAVPKVGDKVPLQVPSSALYYFDGQGRRVDA